MVTASALSIVGLKQLNLYWCNAKNRDKQYKVIAKALFFKWMLIKSK